MFDLTGKTALVTGAARGMGAAHSRALAEQGAAVILTDVDVEAVKKVVEEIQGGGGGAEAYRMDVSNKGEVGSVFDEVEKMYGGVDILVNNAGIYEPMPLLEMSEEQWQKTLDVNLKGQFLCTQRAVRTMMKKRWGRIINISSISSGQAGIGLPRSAHYTASKGGVVGITEALAAELGEYGITVNAVGPGIIDTRMAETGHKSSEETHLILKRLPLKRKGRPEEVAAMVVFLASEESSYVTGAIFFVDGGWLVT